MKFLISTMSDIIMDEEDGKDPVITYNDSSLEVAQKYGCGIEIAEFCMNDNLDDHLAEVEPGIWRKVRGVDYVTLHAPYNELYPSAIDPKYADFVASRYSQALEAAAKYGAKKIIIHAGYLSSVYFKFFFINQSVKFWKRFLENHPGDYEICLENVTEPDPSFIIPIIEGVNDPRMKGCFDVGHANLFDCPLDDWLDAFAPHLSHLHIHNNNGRPDNNPLGVLGDIHAHPGNGKIDMVHILERVKEINPDATLAMETMDIENGAKWLKDNGYI